MKITKLRIQNYKNIQDLTIDFADGLNYAAFVGLNGSGKSNIIEAISQIFAILFFQCKANYFDAATVFNFTIEYKAKTESKHTIIKNSIRLRLDSDAFSPKNSEHFKSSNVIACYSGEETRLYDDIYKQSYQLYFNQIKKSTQKPDYPQMVYLDKSCWDICTIAMLCSDLLVVQTFIRKIFGELDLTAVGISFSVDLPRDKNLVIDFVNNLYAEQNRQIQDNYVSISYIKSTELSGEKLSVKDIFYYLFMSYVPKEIQGANKLIKDLQLHGLDVKSLSEGEKKQILITFINEILADENSLVLFDEPDAHWHIERQKELAKSIACQQHFTILTTHSPILSKFLDVRSIYMLNNISNGIELVDKQNICVINALSGGVLSLQEQNILFSNDEIVPLLVEGKGDVDYINKAISLFAESYPDLQKLLIMPFGGATNAEYFVKEFTKAFPSTRKFIVLFDRDDAGCTQGLNKLAPYSIGKKGRRDTTKYYPVNNMYCLMLPKSDGFSEDDFLIEDYFDKEYISATINEIIGEYKSINKVPKDIRESLKSRLSKPEKMQNYKKEDFLNFKVLLDQLNEIVSSANPSNLVEVAQINLTTNQIKIFADYAPRGHEKKHYDAIFDKTDKSVFYNGERYPSANKTMKNIRLSAGGNRFANAKKFWKYKDESSKVRYLFELL